VPPSSWSTYAYGTPGPPSRPSSAAPGSASLKATSADGYPSKPLGCVASISNTPPDAGNTRTPPLVSTRARPKLHPLPNPNRSRPTSRESQVSASPPTDTPNRTEPSAASIMASIPPPKPNVPSSAVGAESSAAAAQAEGIPPVSSAAHTDATSAIRSCRRLTYMHVSIPAGRSSLAVRAPPRLALLDLVATEPAVLDRGAAAAAGLAAAAVDPEPVARAGVAGRGAT
jgi:hypothetical protein